MQTIFSVLRIKKEQFRIVQKLTKHTFSTFVDLCDVGVYLTNQIVVACFTTRAFYPPEAATAISTLTSTMPFTFISRDALYLPKCGCD